jgi:hypothetical protein
MACIAGHFFAYFPQPLVALANVNCGFDLRSRHAMNTRPSRKQNTDVLQRGIMCTLIGLAVLLGPTFMAPSGMRDMVAQSSLVGWFALVLGVAFLGLYLRRLAIAKKQP